jgi:hypothetical protein
MSVEDVIRRLQEDRAVAEREARQNRIRRAFDAARGPLVVQAEVMSQASVEDPTVARFEQMLADQPDVEVEVVGEQSKRLVSLEQQAAPLLASIRAPRFYRQRKSSHEVGDVFQGRLDDLYAAAEEALGFRAPAQKPAEQTVVQQKSIWKMRQR